MALRSYQSEAVRAAFDRFEAGDRAVLLELATGTGKTRILTEIVRLSLLNGGRALVTTPRLELVDQCHRTLVACGVEAFVEQGERRAPLDARCVVASVASLRGPRLERWPAGAFSLVAIDECHHAPASSYRRILQRFAAARVVGLTATGDRADGQGLGAIFDSLAFRFTLREAIRAGYLVPIVARRVAVDAIDLANVHTRAGDLDARELSAIMASEGPLHAVAVPLLELAGDRQTIAFGVDVAHAHALAATLNQYQPGCARAVDGTMNAERRAATLSDFAAGRFRVLTNVAILTEGYDNPAVSCVAMVRPTKSRALFTQMIGRATRLATGKRDALVLDFTTTNVGRHRLISPGDVLASRDLDDDVRAEFAALLARGETNVDAALDEAEANANAARAQAAITAVARYRAEVIDLFIGELPEAPRALWIRDRATDAQRAALTAAGLDDLPAELSKGEASRWLDALSSRRRAGLATFKQVRLLRRYDIDARRMQWTEANEAIDRIASGRWRKRGAA